MNLLPQLLRPDPVRAPVPDPSRSATAIAGLPALSATARRDETAHRLQVGLVGLGAMVLLVGVADMIMARAQQSDENAVPEAAATVAPSPTPGEHNSALETAGVVPDLPTDVGDAPLPAGPVLPEQGPSPQPTGQ